MEVLEPEDCIAALGIAAERHKLDHDDVGVVQAAFAAPGRLVDVGARSVERGA